jgi:transcriptional regulator with XRE-family HTH domain
MDAFLEKLKKSFVERFTSLMEDNGDSVTEAARIIGVAPEAVSTWLRGRIVPSIDYFAKIADVYNVSVDYLLGQSETQQIKDIPDEAAYPAVPARAFYTSALQLMAKQNSLISQQNALLQQQNAILKAMQQKPATESVSVSLTDGSVDLPF